MADSVFVCLGGA